MGGNDEPYPIPWLDKNGSHNSGRDAAPGHPSDSPCSRGQAVPENQVHDFHPAIWPSGLYWVVEIPNGGLEISADGRLATLRMARVEVPSIQFSRKSDPMETSPAEFGIIGEEANGKQCSA